MLTLQTTKTIVETTTLDLAVIPIIEWPREIKNLISERDIKAAKDQLFPKDYLIAKVEKLYTPIPSLFD